MPLVDVAFSVAQSVSLTPADMEATRARVCRALLWHCRKMMRGPLRCRGSTSMGVATGCCFVGKEELTGGSGPFVPREDCCALFAVEYKRPELSLLTGHTSHSRHRHVEHSLWQLTLLYGNLVAGMGRNTGQSNQRTGAHVEVATPTYQPAAPG
jgi:hypothetical protein